MIQHQKHILYLNHTGEVSGAEKVLLQMLKGLDRARYRPTVLCATNGPLSQAVHELGVECATMSPLTARFTARPDHLLGYLLSILKTVQHTRNHIRSAAPDLIHANTVRAGIVATIASTGLKMPVVWHVHDILPSHPISSGVCALARLSPRTTALCVSLASARAFEADSDFGSRVVVLHNGVDLARFPHKATADADFRRGLGFSAEDFLFCSVGQIAPRKGVVELVSGFASVVREAPHAHLLIVGDSIFNKDYLYRDRVHQLVAELGINANVHFLGARSDVAQIMRSVDVLVLPSLQEPFGLVLVEAISSGTAVLASDVGGIPEIVTNGVTGWLVPPGDSAALGATMLRIAQHPEILPPIQEAACSTVCPRFSMANFLAKLHECYSTILTPKPQPAPGLVPLHTPPQQDSMSAYESDERPITTAEV